MVRVMRRGGMVSCLGSFMVVCLTVIKPHLPAHRQSRHVSNLRQQPGPDGPAVAVADVLAAANVAPPTGFADEVGTPEPGRRAGQ